MPYDKDLWEEIRVLWVTGCQQEAKDKFYNLSKNKMMTVTLSAIVDYWKSTGNHTHNGSLTDLVEIMISITRRNPNEL